MRRASHQLQWFIWLGTAFAVSVFLALGVHAACALLECGPSRDWLPLLTPFVTIGVLIVGYYIWIDQTKLKRRFEVAEKVLLGFVAAEEALAFARSEFWNSAEVADREKPTQEGPDEARIRDRWYVVLKRLWDRRETFKGLAELEVLSGMYLGRDAKQAMHELARILLEVRTSAEMLIETATDRALGATDDLKKEINRWESHCSGRTKILDKHRGPNEPANPVNDRLQAVKQQIQTACRPYLQLEEP